ncbi:hypothetical protein, partial [Enterococcus faecium]|uniref:hypothetical protein n=1 Tax=Enterococcus faecium TaxID=1352 RepID=UPI001364E06B
VEVSQDPTTGNVTLTPKDGAGQTYPEGSTVTVKGLNGGDKTYQIDAKGQVTIPNGDLPTQAGKHEVTVTEPGKTTSTPVSV